jgi:hypothetical protein
MAAAFTLGAPVRAAATADSAAAAAADGDTGQQVILQCNITIVQQFTQHNTMNERCCVLLCCAVAWHAAHGSNEADAARYSVNMISKYTLYARRLSTVLCTACC